MANEVGPVFGGAVNVNDLQSLAAKAQESAQNNPRGGAPNGSDYMNFSGKTGALTIGQDKRKVEDDERWLVDVTSFEEGWVCWKGGQSPSARMANIYTGVPVPQPAPDELGPFDASRGDGWFQAKAMIMKSCDNEEQGYFKINSVSGVSAMADLIGAFSERAHAGLPAWPVIRVEVEQFTSQGYKNFKPKFVVDGWLSNEQMQRLAEGTDIDDLLDEENDAPQVEDQSDEAEDEPEPKAAPRGRRRSRK